MNQRTRLTMRPSGLAGRYMGAVALVGVAAAAILLRAPGRAPAVLVVAFGTALFIAESYQVISPSGEAWSLGSLVAMVCLWLLGPEVPVGAEVIGWSLLALRRRSPLRVTAFNIGQTVLALVSAAAAFRVTGGDWGRPLEEDSSLLPYLASWAAFSFTNTSLVAVAFALHKRVSFGQQLRAHLAADSWRLVASW